MIYYDHVMIYSLLDIHVCKLLSHKYPNIWIDPVPIQHRSNTKPWLPDGCDLMFFGGEGHMIYV